MGGGSSPRAAVHRDIRMPHPLPGKRWGVWSPGGPTSDAGDIRTLALLVQGAPDGTPGCDTHFTQKTVQRVAWHSTSRLAYATWVSSRLLMGAVHV